MPPAQPSRLAHLAEEHAADHEAAQRHQSAADPHNGRRPEQPSMSRASHQAARVRVMPLQPVTGDTPRPEPEDACPTILWPAIPEYRSPSPDISSTLISPTQPSRNPLEPPVPWCVPTPVPAQHHDARLHPAQEERSILKAASAHTHSWSPAPNASPPNMQSA
jgi:hypothetical protein